MVQRSLLKQPALTKMSERTDMVQTALVAQLKDTSPELSPLYEHSAFGGSATKVFQVFRHMGLGCVSINTFFKYQRVSLVSFVFYDYTPSLLILSLI